MNHKKRPVQTVGCIVFFVCSIFRLAATLYEQSDSPVYGVSDLPVAELNENDRIINTFVYADGTTPVLMRKGNTDYYIVSDIRGSVRMVVKVSDGNVLQQMDYDAFGKVTGKGANYRMCVRKAIKQTCYKTYFTGSPRMFSSRKRLPGAGA